MNLKKRTFDRTQFTCRWKYLPAAAKTELAEELAKRFIGPSEVWMDLELAPTPQAFLAMLVAEVDDVESKGDYRYAFLGGGTTPIYVLDAVRILSLLINLQNSIKY